VRTCSICKKDKIEEEFNFKDKKIGRLQKACKECTRKQVRNHYLNNKEYYLLKTRKRNAESRQRIREHIWKYLERHPCVDCGESDPVVLEFDHQRDKEIHVSHMGHNNSSIEKVEKEIAKCQVRCANCHRRKTSLQLGWYRK
jgi:hypothetical protein